MTDGPIMDEITDYMQSPDWELDMIELALEEIEDGFIQEGIEGIRFSVGSIREQLQKMRDQ